MFVIRKAASSGSRRAASSASAQTRANRGSLRPRPTTRAIWLCAMTLSSKKRNGGFLTPSRRRNIGRGNRAASRAEPRRGKSPGPGFRGTARARRLRPSLQEGERAGFERLVADRQHVIAVRDGERLASWQERREPVRIAGHVVARSDRHQSRAGYGRDLFSAHRLARAANAG